MKKIGIVGGISWTSTLDYYKLINEGVNDQLGGLNAAECLIYSLNFAEVQKHTWEKAYPLLLKACFHLKDGGADAIVLAANTAHLFADELQQEVQLPFIDIITGTAKAVKAKELKTVGLLGTKFTMELDFYRKKLERSGLRILIPEDKTVRDTIQTIVKDELGRGLKTHESKRFLIEVAHQLMEQGAEGIILGCTEIPMLLTQADVRYPVFNTTEIHAKAAVDFATTTLT